MPIPEKIKAENIKSFKAMLKRYNAELKKNPKSVFYKGLVKQTKEIIQEMK